MSLSCRSPFSFSPPPVPPGSRLSIMGFAAQARAPRAPWSLSSVLFAVLFTVAVLMTAAASAHALPVYSRRYSECDLCLRAALKQTALRSQNL